MTPLRRRSSSRTARSVAALSMCLFPAAAHAAEPAAEDAATNGRTDPVVDVERAAPAKRGAPQAAFGIGATTGEFVGLPYRALLFDGGVRVERRYMRWIADAELELGRTERGLSLYRGASVGGLENAGRLRIGVGARLSYSMVLRATRDAPFLSAVFGDIGGFGLGAQAWLAFDIVRTESLTLGVVGRGSADVYNGGTATRAGALLEVAF
jgi:hypothetical protein